MNRLIIAVLAALAMALIWLAARQEQINRRLAALEANNARLAEALAQKPDLSREEFAAASRRLENASRFMDAVEGRLTNASALMAQLQAAADRLKTSSRRSTPRVDTTTRIGSERPDIVIDPASGVGDALPQTPASSHSPTGELLQRSWGPEQVLGPPNTFEAGDYPTAWAPRASQGGKNEWLQVNYDRAVEVSEVRVHETYNPGAVAKLVAVLPGGGESVIWEGVMPPAQAPVDTAFPVPAGLRAQSVRIYFDRTRAAGWNEIDAVELVARDGSRQWATSATASSSFADR